MFFDKYLCLAAELIKNVKVGFVGMMLFCMVYGYFEPLISKAASDDDTIIVTQVVSSEITISAPDDVVMSAAIPGITGNEGAPRTGSATWTVITNNATGFY